MVDISLQLDSDRLRKALSKLKVLNASVVVGSNLPYAATHQFGRQSGRGAPIPARPFLGLSPVNYQDIIRIVEEGAVKERTASQVMSQIGEYVVGDTKARFKTETGPDGQRWKALRPATLAAKKRKRKILKILQRDGYLRNSISYRVEL
jgi:phage gpG-like protein